MLICLHSEMIIKKTKQKKTPCFMDQYGNGSRMRMGVLCNFQCHDIVIICLGEHCSDLQLVIRVRQELYFM